MNKLIIILLVISNISCAKKEYKSLDEATPIFLNEYKVFKESGVTEEPYKIEFNIEESENNEYSLVAAVELIEDGSHFVSPFSAGDFSGKFNVSIEENTKLKMDGTFTETPRTVEEFDTRPFVSRDVNWVKENTTYKYPLNVLSKEDFEVSGLLRFVIEPRCTLEEIGFTILYVDGKMKIKKQA